jgi:hypothetical protein
MSNTDLKLASGAFIRNGQLHPARVNRDAPNGFGRDGKTKTALTTTPQLVPGAKRVTKPSHEFLHGAPIDDEPMQKNWEGKGNVAVHPGMTTTPKSDDPFRGLHPHPDSGSVVLADAGRLGRRKS